MEPVKVSLWDFIYAHQLPELEKYLKMVAEAEQQESGSNLMARVLDQRVQQSARFRFHNPVLGAHGYYHILQEQQYILMSNGSTPLHFAVAMQDAPAVSMLLQFCADMTLVDTDTLTAYQMACDRNLVECIESFRTHRDVAHQQRRHLMQLELTNIQLVEEHDAALSKLGDIEAKRESFKTKIRQAAIRATTVMQWRLVISLIRTERAQTARQQTLLDSRTLRKQLELAEQEKRVWFQEKKTLNEHNNVLRVKNSNLERDLNDIQLKEIKNTRPGAGSVMAGENQLVSLQRERAKVRELNDEIDRLHQKLESEQRRPTGFLLKRY